MNTKTPRRLVIGISGASGAIYGVRMLEMLKKTDIETHLVMSKSAEMTLVYETKYKPKDVRALASHFHAQADIGASISSGSWKCTAPASSCSTSCSRAPIRWKKSTKPMPPSSAAKWRAA